MTIRNLDVLFKPQRVLWLGDVQSDAQQAVLDKVRTSGVPMVEAREIADFVAPAVAGERTLGVIVQERHASAPVVQRLGELGCRALIWPLHEPPARVGTVRPDLGQHGCEFSRRTGVGRPARRSTDHRGEPE